MSGKSSPSDREGSSRSRAPQVEPEAATTQRIELGGRYQGLWFEADLEPTIGQYRELGTEQLDPTLAVLKELVTDWNFVDKKGESVPVGEWDRVTLPLIRALLLAYVGALTQGTDLKKA